MTRRQSNNQWTGGIAAHPAPKIPSAKIHWKISRLDFVRSRWLPPHWLSFKGPNYQRGVLPISSGADEGHFEGKAPLEFHKGCLVLARQCPGSPGNCNPEETGLPGLSVFWSPTQFSGSGPVGLPLVLWTEKTIESSSFFVRRGGHCYRGDLAGKIPFYDFFWVAWKSLSNGLRSVFELRGEYVEFIPSLVAVACVLPGRAKDLSAPLVSLYTWFSLISLFIKKMAV